MPNTINITVDPSSLAAAFSPEDVEREILARVEIIAEDAAGKLAERTPVGVYGVAQGAWLQELRVDYEKENSLVVAVSDPSPVAPYLQYVIYGVRAGSPYNPWRHLVEWTRKKLGKGPRVAYLIGRKIQKEGRAGNDFVEAVIDENVKLYETIIQGQPL